MKHFSGLASEVLGIGLPEDYAAFMEKYGKKLPDDPVKTESWVAGLGSADFVIGTTLAFRSAISHFRNESLVIGYLGLKTVIVNKVQEEIDEYLMLDTRQSTVFAVDSLGAKNKLANKFEEWIGPELLRATLREKYTSSFTVLVFDGESRAEEARQKLIKLQHEGALDLEDAVVVVKEQDGKIRTHQLHHMVRRGGIAGSITGLIVGAILLHPLLGAFLGAVTSALSAALTDAGIDDPFIRELSQEFGPGCAALFTLVRKADPERVTQDFLGFGGRVLVSTVTRQEEAAMQEILDRAAAVEAL